MQKISGLIVAEQKHLFITVKGTTKIESDLSVKDFFLSISDIDKYFKRLGIQDGYYKFGTKFGSDNTLEPLRQIIEDNIYDNVYFVGGLEPIENFIPEAKLSVVNDTLSINELADLSTDLKKKDFLTSSFNEAPALEDELNSIADEITNDPIKKEIPAFDPKEEYIKRFGFPQVKRYKLDPKTGQVVK